MERSGTAPAGESSRRRRGMRTYSRHLKPTALAALVLGLASMAWAQSAPSSTPPVGTSPPGIPAGQPTPSAQPLPGTTPVGGDIPAPPSDKKPAPGTTPVGGDIPAPASTVNPEKVVEPGSQKVAVKAGSIRSAERRVG